MKQKFVAPHDIDQVLDGLQKYFQHMVETKTFNADAMKDFMEPIFEQAGYRQSARTRGADDTINIVLIHDSGVGDFINKSAAIREFRRLYPTAHITLIVFTRAYDLAEHCPYVDEVIANSRECDWRSLSEIYRWNIEIARRLLRRRIDVVYAFTQYPSSMLLSYMSGARERISYKFTPEDGALECGPFYLFSSLLTVEVPHQMFGVHSVDNALGLVDYTLHAPVDNREVEVWYSPIDRHGVEELLHRDLIVGNKLIALCMGGSSLRKQWSPSKYAQLAMKILERESDVKFIILGGGSMDERSSLEFRANFDPKLLAEHVLDMTSKMKFRQSAAVLNHCALYIGNDTGTMHMSAAVKTPVLMIDCLAKDLPFENSILSQYYPYRVPSVVVQPEHALDGCRDSRDHYGCVSPKRHCIEQITVETAFDAYERLLARIANNNIEPLFLS